MSIVSGKETDSVGSFALLLYIYLKQLSVVGLSDRCWIDKYWKNDKKLYLFLCKIVIWMLRVQFVNRSNDFETLLFVVLIVLFLMMQIFSGCYTATEKDSNANKRF
jgi:hypothetical protein